MAVISRVSELVSRLAPTLGRIGAGAALLVLLVGCAKEPMSSDAKAPDPYGGKTGQERVEAIRADQKLNSMDRAQQIADAQKAAGLPVTGQ